MSYKMLRITGVNANQWRSVLRRCESHIQGGNALGLVCEPKTVRRIAADAKEICSEYDLSMTHRGTSITICAASEALADRVVPFYNKIVHVLLQDLCCATRNFEPKGGKLW